nr:hypothetical protein [Tanacetum cinerariifolium]
MENVLQENDRLLTQALSVEIVNIVVHDYVNFDCLNVDDCAHCVTTESELKQDFIKKECYETLLKQYHILETHCISLEVNNQLNMEIFQRDTVSSSESAPTFAELFETNDLKAQTYKQLFDSIKSSRVQSKELCDDLIHKVNLKSVEVSDLNANLQEKVLVITALKEQLNKLKGKAVLTEAVSLNPIDPALLQVDVAPLVPKLHKNRTAHSDYIRNTQEEAATLREIIESERLLSPLNTSLDYACKYTRQIQELLMILQQTCPCITDLGTKLVTVTPKNKTKQIRCTAQITKSERTTVDVVPLVPKLRKNMTAHIDYIRHTQEEAATLRELVERVALVSSASGSQSQDNTKKNRIRRTLKKAKETKLEDHLRNEIESLKHTLSEYLKEKESFEQKITILKNDFQKEESKNIDRELALEKQALGFQNPCYLKKAQKLKPNMYGGSVIGKFDVVVVLDSEDTLILAEESRSKMIEKQNDPQMIEKKVITKPIDYAILNQLSTDFNTRFVQQTESSAEQAFWSQYSVQTDEPNLSGTTIVEVLKKLPKVSMVNSCLKKIKFHLASFDMVVKERTTATAITEGTWGFKHTKACFRNEIILFVKNLKELFTSFDQCLIDEVTEVQNVFKQMELAVEQHCAKKTQCQSKMKNVLQENDQILTQALSVEIVNTVVHDYVNFDCLNVDACASFVTTESELKSDFIKKECYETLLQQYHILETHCISLEVNNQLNTKIFQRDTVSSSESAPTFAELFEINELKAQI